MSEAQESRICPQCSSNIGAGVEVVLYSDHRAHSQKLLRMVDMLSRAVVGAEIDLQYNRPTEAHAKLSAAWREWFDTSQPKAEVHAVAPPSDGAPQ